MTYQPATTFVLKAQEMRDFEKTVIQNAGITDATLIDLSAEAFVKKFDEDHPDAVDVTVFCGSGNNGADGLAIARLLMVKDKHAVTLVLLPGSKSSDCYSHNLQRLNEIRSFGFRIITVETEPQVNEIRLGKNTVIIDAIFGIGVNRPIEGISRRAIERINASRARVISVDVPSGMYSDETTPAGNIIITANETYTMMFPKLSFMMSDNMPKLGKWTVLNLRHQGEFVEQWFTTETSPDDITYGGMGLRTKFIPRDPAAHKGIFGHVLVIAGSHGKMGAALLCANAVLRTGAGLCTIYAPACGYDILQSQLPEAMVETDPEEKYISRLPENLDRYRVIVIGPGLGQHPETAQVLRQLLTQVTNTPIVIDADALNIISADDDMKKLLGKHCILSPHPGEFSRFTHDVETDFERHHLAMSLTRELKCILVLKSACTATYAPRSVNLSMDKTDLTVHFNESGGPALAKGGSGDILAGIIAGMIAQNSDTVRAVQQAVFLHGVCGDLAAERLSERSVLARDVLQHISRAYRLLL